MKITYYPMKIKLLPLTFAVLSCTAVPLEPSEEPCRPAASAWTVRSDDTATKAYGIADMDHVLTGTCLAVYDCTTGKRVWTSQSNVQDSHTSPSDVLREGQAYDWYFLSGAIAYDAGGNVRPVFPEDREQVASLRYTYTSPALNQQQYGLDRAGKLTGMTPDEADRLDGQEDGQIHIPLTCLWAKVALRLDLSQLGNLQFDLTAVRAGKGARVLMPFAEDGYAAVSGDEMAEVLDNSSLTEAQRKGLAPIIVYYPENRQGTLLQDNRDPYQKTPEKVASAEPGRENCLSYLTVEGQIRSEFGVHGSGQYRFCIGSDTVSDFSVERNCCYNITLTPTEAGVYFSVWKSDFAMEDTRSLTVTAIRRIEIGGSGPVLYTGSVTGLEAGGTCQAYVTYGIDTQAGPDYTLSQYNGATGWKVRDESVQELQEAGISWHFDKRVPFISYTGKTYYWTEEEYNRLANSSPTYSGLTADPGWQGFFIFEGGASLPEGRVIPVTVETFDGRKKATFTINTGTPGGLLVGGLEQTRYIGQKGILKATELPAWASKVRYSVAAGSEQKIAVTARDDRSCLVSLIGSGSAKVNIQLWNGSAWIGEDPVSGKAYTASIDCKVPRLYVEPESVLLEADGTKVPVQVGYRTEDGQEMTLCNGVTTDGLGLDRSLYDTYLKPVFTYNDPAGRFLNPGSDDVAENRQLAVRCLTAGGQSIRTYLGRSFASAVEIGARACSDVTLRRISVTLAQPFRALTASSSFGDIDNHVLDGYTLSSHVSGTSVAVGEALPPDTGLGIAPAQLQITSSAADIAFSLGSDRRIHTAPQAATTPSSGRYTLTGTLTNLHSGQSLTQAIGYVEIYLHATFCGIAKAPSEAGDFYKPDFLTGQMIPAASVNVKADITTSLSGGTPHAGLQQIRSVLEGQKFLYFGKLPDRFASTNQVQIAYNPDYMMGTYHSCTVGEFINRAFCQYDNGSTIPDSNSYQQVLYAESYVDFSRLRCAYWYSMTPFWVDDPRYFGTAVWTYYPGKNVRKAWNARKTAHPALYPDDTACFLADNPTPNLRVDRAVLDGLLSHRDYGDWRYYYPAGATLRGAGVPYEVLCVNRNDSIDLPCSWSSLSLRFE